MTIPPHPPGLTAVSLFAGVGGIDLAFTRAGIQVTAAVEIDTAARGVIADQLPDTHLFTDVTEVTGDDLIRAGFVPERGILTAGWPCQGNSVAGARGGMADPRSGLWRHVVRLLAETRARWFLGENVPGLLSVNDGADVAVVRSDLAQLGYLGADRILDAQYFGVPQRRRRVFFVGCLGDGARPVRVLLEPEGGGRNHPPSRTERARVAPTLEAGANETGGTRPPGSTVDTAESLVVVDTASTLQGGGRRGHRIDAESAAGGHLVVQPLAIRGRDEGAQLEVGPEGGPYNALRAGDGGSSRQSLVAIRTAQQSANGHGIAEGVAHTLDSANGQAIAFSHTAGIDHQASDRIAPTTKTESSIAIYQQHGTNVGPMGTLRAGNGTETGGVPFMEQGTTVRRLTPLECERLQGFPDNWTATSGGKPQTDSARYKQMGNAVAVPCVEWIARRIASAA